MIERKNNIIPEIAIENLENDYLSEDYILPQPDFLYRIVFPSGERCYALVEDEKVIFNSSVTTIIPRYVPMNIYLLKWWCLHGYEGARKIMLEKARLGTFQHIINAEIAFESDVDLSRSSLLLRIYGYLEQEGIEYNLFNIKSWIPKIQKNTLGFIQWIKDYNVKFIAIETTLFSREKRYAGTIDFAVTMNESKKSKKRIKAIVDYKSGEIAFYEHDVIQLQGYIDLWNETYPDRKINRFFNLGSKDYRLPLGKTVTPYRIEEQTKKETVWKWQDIHKRYLLHIDSFMPKIRTEIKDGVVNKDTNIESLIAEINPEQKFLENIEVEECKAEF